MPAKKGGRGKKTVAKDANAPTWADLTKRLKTYIAKTTDARSAERHPMIETFKEYEERPKKVKQVIVSTPVTPVFIKALTQTLIDFKWTQVTALCFWNVNCGDEGAAAVSEALHHMPWITKLEMLDCNLGPKACYHLGNALSNPAVNIQILRLDCNPLEGMGVKWLSEAFIANEKEASLERPLALTELSLSYCSIGYDGGMYLANTLSIKRSHLQNLNLEGNALKARGIIDLSKGISVANSLVKLNIAQNKFADDLKMIDSLARAFHHNTKLTRINLDGNLIGNDGCKYFIEFLHESKHIIQFDVTPFVGPMHYRAVHDWLRRNKPDKKKKKRKKKTT